MAAWRKLDTKVLLLGACLGAVRSQQAGTLEREGNPTIPLRECTRAGGCTSRDAKLVMDANWRWVHSTSGYVGCFKDAKWNEQLCPDSATCALNCALEGVNADHYQSSYGVTSVPGGVKLGFATKTKYGTNVGSRLYVMGTGTDSYHMFRLKNREFSIDVDSSQLECGMNGAAYFIEMDEKGGLGQGNNRAGARFGTGYCDAQCPHDMKFINGIANTDDWKPNPKDESGAMGLGRFGSCCAEMDIWEANKMSTSYTPHPCTLNTPGSYRCDSTECGDNDKNERYKGVCDKDGCDLNPFRMGNQSFYGPGPEFVVDSSRPITVVTQFLTNDGTDDGELTEIRRFYVQDGKTVWSPPAKIMGASGSGSSITDSWCDTQKTFFHDPNDFAAKGGNAQMGKALDRGLVLALSLWDDVESNMLWLDSAYPPSRSRGEPGVARGSCPGGRQSTPSYIRGHFPNSFLIYANLAVGEINSTTTPKPRLVYP